MSSEPSENALPGVSGSTGIPESPVNQEPVLSLKKSQLYQTWRDRVVKDDNDFIIAIAASTRTSISGTGKSTLATQLAERFDISSSGFNAEEKASLDSEEIAEELYPNLPNKSSIIFDEAQGTLGSDGVDSRKAMANAVVKMSRSAATFRYKQHTLIIVAQSTAWLDSRMMDLIDRLVLIQEKNPEDKFARAVVFDHYREDLPSNSTAKEYTPAIEDIYWEPEPVGRSEDFKQNYEYLHRLKEKTAEKEETDDDSTHELTDKQRRELARSLYQDFGLTQGAVAQHPMIDRTQSWVSKVVTGQ